MLYHSITPSITFSITMSSSKLEITMADLWEVLQHASVDIIGPLNTAQMTSGSTRMAAVQELYLITVSIPNIFINTWLKQLTLFTEGMAYRHMEGDEHFKFKGEHFHSSPTHLALCQLDHECSDQQCSCRCNVKCRTFRQCRLRNHQRWKSSGKTHISL